MKRSTLIVASVAIAAIAGTAAWKFIPDRAESKHQWVKKIDEQGKSYWTCAMHPEVRQDHPGNCPICGMQLLEKKMEVAPAAAAERTPLYWYDPMKPEAHFDKPGKSPFMDMDLVPMYADENADAKTGDGGLQIDPQMVQNLGVRTTKVTRGDATSAIRATGVVEIDERRIVVIESRSSGWLEQLNVRAVGDAVQRGQAIANVYSPDLYAAQQELALAARTQDDRLIDATRQRLALLGVSPNQSAEVLKSGVAQRRAAIVAPQSGVVTELKVRQGQQITPGMPIMSLADLSKVWIVLQIPEAQSATVREGQIAEARFNALPGKVLKGTVEYVYPNLDAPTRTLRARVSFNNPDLMLKPGMYADVSLQDGGNSEMLSVPSEAVIRSGTRSVVILALGGGKFRPAVVEVGKDFGGWAEIVSGLEEGETIVVSGQFLIDSEASLRGTLARMSAAP